MFAIVFLVVALACVALPDAYLWLVLLRGHAPAWWGGVIVLPSAVILAGLACGMAGWWNDTLMRLMFGCLMCAALPKLAFCLLSAPGWARVAALNAAGLVAAAAVLAGNAYGFARGWKRLTVSHTDIALEGLAPAFEGYRIVQISDLHIGTFGRDTAHVRRIVDRIAALEPDLVVFSGDLVNSSPDELEPFAGELARLAAPDGVVSVLGNHDYCRYNRYATPDGAARATRRLVRAERALGWRLLMNEHTAVARGGDTLYVAGVENVGRPPFPSHGDLDRALAGIPAGGAVVLLSHDPQHWRAEVLADGRAGLMLAGHTHAMQLRLFGFSPAAWISPEWGGLYSEGRRHLYVSTGTGGNLPYRLGAWPEIAVIELHAPEPH